MNLDPYSGIDWFCFIVEHRTFNNRMVVDSVWTGSGNFDFTYLNPEYRTTRDYPVNMMTGKIS